MKKYNCGIYQIRNILDNKIYIGSSTNLQNRKSTHFRGLKNNNHDNAYLQYSFNKYGEESFVFEIICYTDLNCEYLLYLENNFIQYYKTNEHSQGYNLRKDASNNFGMKRFFPMSQETKNKISLSNIGQKRSEETKQNMRSTKGHRKHFVMSFRTKEHIRHISESKKGKKLNLSDKGLSFRTENMIGSKNVNAKLKEKDVVDINIMIKNNVAIKNIAGLFNVSFSTIYRIRNGQLWSQIKTIL